MTEPIELNGLPSRENNYFNNFTVLTFFLLKSCLLSCQEKYWVLNNKIEKCLSFFSRKFENS